MPIFIPPYAGEEIPSKAEIKIFKVLQNLKLKNAYILHSLGLPKHADKLYGEIDFLVVCELGVACLEIKGGRIECKDGKWFFINRHGERHYKSEGPFSQCSGNMFSLRDALRKNPFKKGDSKNVQMASGVMFPDIQFEYSGEEIIPEVLYDKRTKDITKYIEDVFDYWKTRQERRTETLSKKDIENIVQYLRGNFSFIPTLESRLGEVDNRICRLTERQSNVIHQFSENPRLLVKGGAGTGKTMIAVDFALKCAQRGDKVLYLTFNKNLAKSIKPIEADENLKIINIHALYGDYVEVDVEVMQKDAKKYFTDTLPLLFSNWLKSLSLDEQDKYVFDVLVIDEGQDVLRKNYLHTMDLLLKGGMESGRWALFYDADQNLYNDEFELGMKVLQTYPSARCNLFENCRNTEQIGEFIHKKSGISTGQCICGDGEEVTVIKYKTDKEYSSKLRALVQELKKEEINLDDVTILAPKKYEKLKLYRILNDICSVHVMQNEEEQKKDSIRFSTIQGFKGLDSRIVILTEMEGVLSENYQRYMYIGISRARAKLYVFEAK